MRRMISVHEFTIPLRQYFRPADADIDNWPE